MATCPKCKKHFNFPEDEQDLHACPRCGNTSIRYTSVGSGKYIECDECDSIHPREEE